MTGSGRMNLEENHSQTLNLAARSVFPAAVLSLAVLASIGIALVWSIDRADLEAAAQQRESASQAFVLAEREAQTALRDAIQSTLAEADIPGAVLRQGAGFAAAGQIAADGTPANIALAASPHASISRARASQVLQTALAQITSDLKIADALGTPRLSEALHDVLSKTVASGRIVVAGGEAYLPLIAAPGALNQPGRPPLFAIVHLSASLLEPAGSRFGLRRLRLVSELSEAAGRAGLPLLTATGQRDIALVWEAQSTTAAILNSVLPAVVLGGAILMIFFALIYAHMRTVTHEMVHAEARATHLASHDALSGLPNRRSFFDSLSKELLRSGGSRGSLAVLFIDLDKFKEVNDTMGHQAGDQLIFMMGARIREALRGRDMLARLGGDEFAVIQTNVHSIEDVTSLSRRLLEQVREPFDIDGAKAYVGMSVGIAMSPQNSRSAEDLMRFADVALYRAKTGGRNRFAFFENQLDEDMRLRRIVDEDLREAIENDKLTLVYQPQVAADGGSIKAVEALVRWNHPVHGNIPPARFIPIAEERGQIVALGEWALRRACRDAKAWPEVTISVNVSAVQFKHTDFVATVSAVLEESGFDPARLEIELTEGVVVDDADAAEAAMFELRGLGVRMALDDFGTGYSSLIYLRRFAFDKIKIDKSFLDSMEATGESAILVHSVVHLGRALGLTVTAEGVETEEQARFLQAVGCHLLQGYLFSKPVPPSEITRMLAAGGIVKAA